MSSFGSGFAAGLNNGMSMGKMLMDTYNDAKQKDELEQAQKLDQSVTDTLTPDQQTTADYVRDPNNGYEVEDTTGKGLRFRTAGSDNSWTDLNPGAKSYTLGGVTRDKEFSQDEIARARADAIVGVYTKNGDPMRGLQYKQAAREDRTFSATEAARNEYMTGLEELADPNNHQKFIPQLLEAYNNAPSGSKHDDKHFGVYDPERNVVAFSNQKGQIVNTIPVNQQTLTAGLKELYMQKLEALDPKLGLQREELGIKHDTLTETGRHNKAYEGLMSQRIGLAGGGGNSFKALEQKAGVFSQALMKADPNLSQADAEKRAWQVLTHDTIGLKGDAGAQVEYDDGDGTKMKGTAAQIHAARMATDPVYAAGKGRRLAMQPNGGAQTGGAKSAAPVRAYNIDYSDAAYDNYLKGAKSGDLRSKQILSGWANANELTAGQRKEAEKYIR